MTADLTATEVFGTVLVAAVNAGVTEEEMNSLLCAERCQVSRSAGQGLILIFFTSSGNGYVLATPSADVNHWKTRERLLEEEQASKPRAALTSREHAALLPGFRIGKTAISDPPTLADLMFFQRPSKGDVIVDGVAGQALGFR